MLQTIAIVLLVLWLLGVVTGNVFGGFIYALLVIGVVLFLVRFLGGRKTA
ncbi:MAG: lmo0937 family membrane protein [Trueperaceae bacterium]